MHYSILYNFNKIRETKYAYDNLEFGAAPTKGSITKSEQWLDSEGDYIVNRFQYDTVGNLIHQTDPLGRVTEFEYGLTHTTFTYPERIINALGHKTDYSYDIFGNVLAETKNGITKYNQYDVFGRIKKEILPYDSSDLPTKSYSYTFDGSAPEIIKISQRTERSSLEEGFNSPYTKTKENDSVDN